MLAQVTHILPVTTIQRERMLPMPGRVLVRKGQKVNPADVVAETVVSPEHLLLDVGRGLGIPPEEADQYIKVQAGAQLDTGDVIAERGAVARRIVRCPQPGKVVVAGGGQVLLELESKPFELKSGLTGIVVELYPDRGVLIETTGALVQGVWGNGGVDAGLLTVKAKTPDDELRSDRLDVSLRGSVVLGGYCGDIEVIRQLDDLPLRGLVLASMSTALIGPAMKVKCPVIVLDGFGKLPMNPAAFKLLSTSDRREISVNAARWDRLAATRPEVVIPLPANPTNPPAQIVHFKPNQQVRILRAPHRGQVAELITLLPEPVALPNGLRTVAAEVKLETDEKVIIPLANLEVLG
jgi:hypothetical protein